MQLQPLVRIILTFLVAALSTVIALVPNQTIRLVCAPIVSGLAAIGIVPPQVPIKTVAIGKQDGYARNDAVAVILIIVCALLLWQIFSTPVFLLLLLLILLFVF